MYFLPCKHPFRRSREKKVILFFTVPPFLVFDSVSEVPCKTEEPSKINNFSTHHSFFKMELLTNLNDDDDEIIFDDSSFEEEWSSVTTAMTDENETKQKQKRKRGGGSRPGKAPNKKRDYLAAHRLLIKV